MAELTTTSVKVGINGITVSPTGSHTIGSTATSSVVLTCNSLEDVVLSLYHPVPDPGTTACTVTVSASTATYASVGRGTLTLTTNLTSSDYAMIANLESAWLQSTSNVTTFTFTTAISCILIEQSSTRQN